LVTMSKDRTALGSEPAGELVGISRISRELFEIMLDYSEDVLRSTLDVDYETDCLVGVAAHHPIPCRVAEGLLWAEIDDPDHLARARTSVYPAIRARDVPSAV